MATKRSGKAFKISEYPTYLMGRIMYRHIQIMTERLRELDYGFSHWRVLSILKENGSLNVQKFSELMSLERTALGRLLDSMEADGLVASKVASEDRRHRHVSITAKGEDLFDRMLPAALRQLGRVMDGISPEEAKQLTRILRRIKDNLDGFPFRD